MLKKELQQARTGISEPVCLETGGVPASDAKSEMVNHDVGDGRDTTQPGIQVTIKIPEGRDTWLSGISERTMQRRE